MFFSAHFSHHQLFSQKKHSQCASHGQSLIEVTFATAVVSIVLVAILSSVIQSVRNSRVALEQTQSTNYAQQGLEWTRNQRDVIGWGVFSSSLATRGNDVTFCTAQLPATFADLLANSIGTCESTDTIPGTQFVRELHLVRQTPTEVLVEVFVTRPGQSGEITTHLETVLTDWK